MHCERLAKTCFRNPDYSHYFSLEHISIRFYVKFLTNLVLVNHTNPTTSNPGIISNITSNASTSMVSLLVVWCYHNLQRKRSNLLEQRHNIFWHINCFFLLPKLMSKTYYELYPKEQIPGYEIFVAWLIWYCKSNDILCM